MRVGLMTECMLALLLTVVVMFNAQAGACTSCALSSRPAPDGLSLVGIFGGSEVALHVQAQI